MPNKEQDIIALVRIIAHAGDTVTCPSGHYIATVVKDIYSHTPVNCNPFADWSEEFSKEPEDGDFIEPCPVCGEPFLDIVQYPWLRESRGIYLKNKGWSNNG